MSSLIPLEEAWGRLLNLIQTLPLESVLVDTAHGRFLAEDVTARRTQPAVDLSAMDGFAVAGTGPWTIVGESRAGAPFDRAIKPCEATRISTGAHMPVGADAVLIVENAHVDSDHLTASEAPQLGQHIRRAGFDFAKGDILLPPGVAISPAALGLIRAAGLSEVSVSKRPKVAIIECGDEMVADPADYDERTLPASNGAMVAAMANQVGANVTQIGPVPDDLETLAEAFAKASDADLVITSGGASVGEHDLVKPVLEKLGAELDFWKVAIRPGKPLLVAKRGKQVILGLPGNPVSTFVTAFLFALPAIRALQGDAAPLPRTIPLALGSDLGPVGTRQEFVRARLMDGRAEPISERDSSALLALSLAELLIDRPINAGPVAAGEYVDCFFL